MHFSFYVFLLSDLAANTCIFTPVTVTVTVLPVTCGAKPSPSDEYDDQEDVEKAAQEECETDDDLQDEEDDGCVGINLHHCIG